MQTITKYKANDGCEFKNEHDALKRDQLVAEIDAVMAPINPAPKCRDHQYAQHDPKVVIACRVAILKLCAREFPSFEIFRHQPPEEVHPRSIAGRILDDNRGPLSSAWYRFMLIDDKGREWEQPYYAANTPADAVKI